MRKLLAAGLMYQEKFEESAQQWELVRAAETAGTLDRAARSLAEDEEAKERLMTRLKLLLAEDIPPEVLQSKDEKVAVPPLVVFPPVSWAPSTWACAASRLKAPWYTSTTSADSKIDRVSATGINQTAKDRHMAMANAPTATAATTTVAVNPAVASQMSFWVRCAFVVLRTSATRPALASAMPTIWKS